MNSAQLFLRRLAAAFSEHLRRRGAVAAFLCTLVVLPLTGLHISLVSAFFDQAPAERASTPSLPPPALRDTVDSETHQSPEILRTVDGTMRKGTGFVDNLVKSGLPAGEAQTVADHLSSHLDFRRLRAGDRYSISYGAGNTLVRFAYRADPLEELVLSKTSAGWSAAVRALPYEMKVETIVGTIETSLFESLERLGEKDRLAMDFVDILAWDIDFSHELRRGDRYRIVVEKITRDGNFLTYGRILAAEYRDSDELHQACFYPYPADGGGYYSPDGQSVQKTFLRAPVSYSRISSGYSRRRLHPVTRKVQPHRGIDYAAPTGTPVWAPADGTVTSVSRDRRNGKKVVLRHAGGYTTYYLHLSRFARGIRKGKKVKQKDVIGYVGSTGRVTGPHLDYRMKKHGAWRNPLKEKFPPGKPLPKEFLDEFAAYREWLGGGLSTPSGALAALGEKPASL